MNSQILNPGQFEIGGQLAHHLQTVTLEKLQAGIAFWGADHRPEARSRGVARGAGPLPLAEGSGRSPGAAL